MKKILCICMALVLALGSFCALAEEDLQAQLDAANEKIAELQAQVDAYYPYYAAQIVATYGADGIIWLEDVEAQYAAAQAQYASYGIDLASYGMEETVKKSIVDSAVQSAVLLDKAAELGLDAFDEETMAELEASAEAMMQEYADYYISQVYSEADEITDEMRAEAEKYWADNGLSYESCLEDLKTTAIFDAVDAYATKDVSIVEEDVQAAYQTLIEENKANYENASSYISDRSAGVAIAWNPEGYRSVKHVLVKFNDEQAALYADLQSQLDSLNAEKEAIENPAETEEASAETEEAPEVTPEPTPEPRSIEAINADIAACATEIEALYAQLMPTAEEVIAAFDGGTSFDELIEKYNEDPGMQSEPTASAGYAVAEGVSYWDPAFTEGAMSIANKGEISAPVYGANGIHIIYYLDDIPAGEVALDEIRTDVEAQALDAKVKAAYDAQVAAWLEEAGVEYFYANFGVAE